MNKKTILFTLFVITLLMIGFITFTFLDNHSFKTHQLEATVISVKNDKIIVQDNSHIIYTFEATGFDAEVGSHIIIEYTGQLDKNKEKQNCEVVDYTTTLVFQEENETPTSWQDNGIFSSYYKIAYHKLKTMSLDEKIGQILLVRYPDSKQKEILETYQFGGYVFYEKDFKGKTEKEVQDMMKELQEVAQIPILTAVDEEGGKVVRISSNPNLRNEKFQSSKELYLTNSFEEIKKDTIEKSNFLSHLGINLNLAPVIDVSTNPIDYMYERAFGQDTNLTSDYAKTVIEISKNYDVSYTLKHFPGYGNNQDTHTGSSIDSRTYQDILDNDLPPFKAGIQAGAEAILVSHNIVTSIDNTNPASLSPSVHNLLRNELNFTGIVITDDLAMGAISSIDDAIIKAILAGNDLIITTNYENDINQIKTAIYNGTISEDLIDKLAFRVIAWKYYKGLMFDLEK